MNQKHLLQLLIAFGLSMLFACQKPVEYDLIIRNALVYDGSGAKPFSGDVAIQADTVVQIGDLKRAKGKKEIDAKGMAVSPGFVNMLSWGTESLLIDPRGLSDLKQGVTLEVMGEGWSMGPINPTMKAGVIAQQGDLKFDVYWRTLGEYLQGLEDRGVSMNVASFVGATTLRIHEVGYDNRPPTSAELARMQELAKEAMEEGAMGIGSSLIYAPAFYAGTAELVALNKIAAAYGGRYITHMRSEGNRFLEALDETLEIAKKAGIAAEIYHLKAGGKNNWHKMDLAIAKIDSARAAGLDITTDMYNYVAGATGLDASMPPWVQEGGYDAWASRLKDPKIRKQVMEEMRQDAQTWENLYYAAGGAENLLLVEFKADSLKKYTGKTLAEVAKLQGKSPEETAIDLVIHDGTRVGVVYFMMSEENVKKQLRLPYMSFGSDAGALAAEGDFLKSATHPRAYGNFARLLGKYVREEKVISLEEAIHKLTALPCAHLKIQRRGLLKPGYFADIVLFDPKTIADKATFEDPHQYAVGVQHVFVNGVHVLDNGEATGKAAGRFVKGPGYKPKRK